MLETTPVNQIDNLVFAFSIVILAIIFCAGLAFFLKQKFNLGVIKQKLDGNKHLYIVETLNIDQKRKLILIRKDKTEHLVLTGGPTDLLIATNLTPTTPGASTGITEPKEVTEQEAIDFFDQARNRIFSEQETGTPGVSAQAKAFIKDEPDDFQTLLQIKRKDQERRSEISGEAETSEEKMKKLKALLDKARQSRNR